jgi:hypothetical protein
MKFQLVVTLLVTIFGFIAPDPIAFKDCGEKT